MSKKYIDGMFIREHKFADGGTILKISIPVDAVDKMCQQIKAAAENGWTRLEIFRMKQPMEKNGKVMASHSIAVDEWKPDMNKMREAVKPAVKPADDEPVPF